MGFSCALMITWEGLLSCAKIFFNLGHSLTLVCRVFTEGLTKYVSYLLEKQVDCLTKAI